MSEHFEREGSQFWGLLDTGAQSACIGTNRWKVLQQRLLAHGLQPILVDGTQREAKGIGGSSKTLGTYDVPLAMGKICG
eukprot:6264583-Amphidinium_carterae.1